MASFPLLRSTLLQYYECLDTSRTGHCPRCLLWCGHVPHALRWMIKVMTLLRTRTCYLTPIRSDRTSLIKFHLVWGRRCVKTRAVYEQELTLNYCYHHNLASLFASSDSHTDRWEFILRGRLVQAVLLGISSALWPRSSHLYRWNYLPFTSWLADPCYLSRQEIVSPRASQKRLNKNTIPT